MLYEIAQVLKALVLKPFYFSRFDIKENSKVFLVSPGTDRKIHHMDVNTY